jgi:hypothetical protein
MAASRIGGGWVEAGLVRLAGPHCLGHFVVDFEDDTLGAVVAPLLLTTAKIKPHLFLRNGV